MTVVLLVNSVEAGDYYYRGYEFIELKSVEGAACELPGIPSLSTMVPSDCHNFCLFLEIQLVLQDSCTAERSSYTRFTHRIHLSASHVTRRSRDQLYPISRSRDLGGRSRDLVDELESCMRH